MTVEVEIGGAIGAFAYDVAFSAGDELLVLYGHSGAGKTVTLRAVAGLERPQRGRIAIAGAAVFDAARGISRPPQARRTGYVVQDAALFPHLDVRHNVLIGVEHSAEARRRWADLRTLLRIEELDERRPHQLSGGQQQRVALARALVRPTDVLLLDEPFSALDDSLREGLRSELVRLHRELALPILFVTHDLREAHLLADRIAVIDDGRILQVDARDRVFRRPLSRRVAELTGVRNLWPGSADGRHVVVAGLPLRLPDDSRLTGAVDVGIRSERCNLRRLDPDGALPENCFVASVVEELAFGNTHTLVLEPEAVGPRVLVEVAARPYEVLHVADVRRWVVELPPDDLQVMRPASEREPVGG